VQQILKALAAGQTPADILLYAADVVGEQRVCRLSA